MSNQAAVAVKDDKPMEFKGRLIIKPGDNGCWEWGGHRNKRGYGRAYGDYAHRVSWRLFNGDIPPGINVLHKCDNPPCCRPDHLFLGTQKVNLDDCASKGRMSCGSSRPEAKLVEMDIRTILRIKAEGVPQIRIAEMFGVSKASISGIVNRKTWRHVTV